MSANSLDSPNRRAADPSYLNILRGRLHLAPRLLLLFENPLIFHARFPTLTENGNGNAFSASLAHFELAHRLCFASSMGSARLNDERDRQSASAPVAQIDWKSVFSAFGHGYLHVSPIGKRAQPNQGISLSDVCWNEWSSFAVLNAISATIAD